MSEAAKATNDNAACSHCQGPTAGGHFCPGCGRIQPLSPGTDFFSFLGLPRRLRIDEPELEREFYSLSRKFHPDYFMAASLAEQNASIERSSTLNDAYRTLRDRVARAQYLLLLEGYKEAEKRAPAELLEEVFELNMQVEELKAAKSVGDQDEIAEARASLERTLSGLRDKLAEIDEQLLAVFGDWDIFAERADAPVAGKPALDRISEILSHRSYVRNLAREIEEAL